MSRRIVDFPAPERAQVIARGNALGELSQVGTRQRGPQLGLPHEDDFEELLPRGLQVGQQPDLLEDIGRQRLGLVDDEDRAPRPGEGSQQVPVKPVDKVFQRGTGGMGDAELVADSRDELGRRQLGIENKRDIHRVGETLEQGAHQRRLARADLAREQDESPRLVDTV